MSFLQTFLNALVAECILIKKADIWSAGMINIQLATGILLDYF